MLTEEHREQKKQEILHSCFELFVKQGLENTSLNDMTAYCKTYKAAFYTYFKSKDEIVLESTKMYMKELDDMFYNEFLNPQPSLKEALQRGFSLIIEQKNMLRYIYQVISSPKYGEVCQKELSSIYMRYLNYSDIFARIYKVSEEKFRPHFLLLISTINDFCLWGNKNLVDEKLDYIYKAIELL